MLPCETTFFWCKKSSMAYCGDCSMEFWAGRINIIFFDAQRRILQSKNIDCYEKMINNASFDIPENAASMRVSFAYLANGCPHSDDLDSNASDDASSD